MADFSGIGAFGAGALQGYNQGLSNYADLYKLKLAQDAETRAKQAQALQSLIHGSSLAQTNPDVAEQAMNNPEYGLKPEEIGPGVAASRAMAQAEARLNAAIQSGDLSGVLDDPIVGKVIASKPKEYLGAIKDITTRKKVDAILHDPNLTPQQKAASLISAGAQIPQGMLENAYPELGGAKAEATAGGTMRGKLPYAGVLAEAEALGKGKGELVTAGPLSQAKKQGEINADLSPDVTPPGVPIGGTNTGRLAQERETPAQRERRLRGPASNEVGPKDVSAALNRLNTSARNDVTAQLKNVTKDTWVDYTPVEQQQLKDYLVNQRMRALAENDPVAKGRVPEMPRPAVMDKFEQLTKSSWWAKNMPTWLGGGESTPQPQISAPRTLRQPAPSANGGWGKAEVIR